MVLHFTPASWVKRFTKQPGDIPNPSAKLMGSFRPPWFSGNPRSGMKGQQFLNWGKGVFPQIWSNYSDLTRPHPKWWFSKGNPLISGKSRLVKYYNI